jgi:hypothetical protein
MPPGVAETPVPPSQPAPGPEVPGVGGMQSAPPPEAPQPPSQPLAGAVAVAVPVALDLASLRAVWPAVLEELKSSGNTLCAHRLADTQPIAVDGTQVTVAFAPETESVDYNMRKADGDEDRACVAEAIRTLTGGTRPQIAYVLGAETAAVQAPPAAPTDSEWVERFVAEFDAEEIHPESEAS